MPRTLLIQLERVGDLIMSTPLLRDLIQSDPQGQVDLLLIDGCQDAVRGLPRLGEIRRLSDGFQGLDDQLARSFKREIPPECFDVLGQLALPPYDRVINTSHSALGCWLTDQVRCGSREGGTINQQGECLFWGDPFVYRVAMTKFREQNWFHITDLMRSASPVKSIPSPGSRPYVDMSDGLPFALPSGRKVALNPGSSERHRRWPPGHFAWLAEKLNSRGFVPLLVGAPSDQPACAEVARSCPVSLPNFCGQTSIPQMARLLSEVTLLVSVDTGAVHIGSAAGTTVLGLCGSTAYFSETSPWGQGHLILQLPLGSDFAHLTPELVLTGALNRLGLLPEADLSHALQRDGVAGWETFFLPLEADPLGGLAYRPLHQDHLEVEGLFTRALRHAFARVFCGGQGKTSLDYLGAWARPTLVSDTARVWDTARAISEALASRAQVIETMAQATSKCRELCGRLDQETGAQISVFTSSVIQALELLKKTAGEVPLVKPVIYNLDWKLRMMLPLEPEATFRTHEQECRSAASLLLEAASLVRDFVEKQRRGQVAGR